MDNYEITTQFDWEGNAYEVVRIDHGNDQYTSMTKEHWDKLEAEREQSGTL